MFGDGAVGGEGEGGKVIVTVRLEGKSDLLGDFPGMMVGEGGHLILVFVEDA